MDIILLPFRLLWALLGFVFALTGRLAAAVIGLVLLILGAVLTVTVVGACIGIPLLIFGILLVIRAFF